ncbi:hypothetical protein [Chondromyces crocatus]|uniref:hypothetical protein n=1 Tax=Chondromyces crocatus TaxID=52 RepID=UPI0012E12A7D|nr:hypothetical protein [Chondromyces crocatus]
MAADEAPPAEVRAPAASSSVPAALINPPVPSPVTEAPTPSAEPASTADSKGEASTALAAAAPEDAKKLQKEALSLLNRGRNADAIEVSRAAIAADPTDALSYLYLGSALQDSGKWKEGIAAYSDCVRTATKGPVHECSAMGGRK